MARVLNEPALTAVSTMSCLDPQDPAIARLALERGVNYFDTSPDYSGSGSEQSMGRVIADVRRDDLFVATKFCLPRGHLAEGSSVDYLVFEDEGNFEFLKHENRRRAYRAVADFLEVSPAHVYGVATFYNQFRFNPPGKNPIKVCLGTACHVKGGDIILENFERKLEIKEGETTPDREFSVDRVACVGCCALAPVTVVGETVYGHMQPSKVEGLVLRTRLEKEMQEREKQKNEPTE